MSTKRKRYYWKGKLVTKIVYEKRLKQANSGKARKKMRVEEVSEKKEPGHVHESDSQEAEMNTETNEFIQQTKKADNPVEESTSDKSIKPGEGCRIVDLAFLGQQLWCTFCKECLSLKNIENEERQGLGSTLSIECHKCLILNIVVTGKQHTPAGVSRRNSRFDVNTKFVTGLTNTGVGFTNMNKILACLNIPTLSFRTYKRYESEVGKTLESIAKDNCEQTVEKEKNT